MLSTERILTVYQENAKPEFQQAMSDYMRGKFPYFGIKTPLRREISKPFFLEAKALSKDECLQLVKELWQQPERELHHLAQEIYLKEAKRLITDKADMSLLEWMVLHNSWWDTIDLIAPKIMRVYFDKFPEEREPIVNDWIQSGNIWLQRCSLLIHLKLREKPNFDLMFKTILRLTGTDEFFVDKAIGWLLREYAKKHEEVIISFVLEHQKSLSNLSVREALKHHPKIFEKINPNS